MGEKFKPHRLKVKVQALRLFSLKAEVRKLKGDYPGMRSQVSPFNLNPWLKFIRGLTDDRFGLIRAALMTTKMVSAFGRLPFLFVILYFLFFYTFLDSHTSILF
jgi:hypothetical protein